MARKIFVNLPVTDLDKSVAFFTTLGFEFNAQFTDENATSMVVNDDAAVMLLVREFFTTFTDKAVADTTASTEAIVTLSADSREDVDDLVNKAISAGGRTIKEPQDHGFMYGWGFEDLDGHLWEVMWMDPTAVEG